MRRLRSFVIAVLIGSFVFAPGCTRKHVAKVAPFERGRDETVVKPAPRSGMYHVQFVENDRYINDAGVTPTRYVRKGEPVGFRESDDGQVVALVAGEELPVVGLPERATHVMWYHKSKQPTQFAKSMSKTGEAVQKALIAVSIGAVAVAATAVVFSCDVDCDDETPPYRKKRRH